VKRFFEHCQAAEFWWLLFGAAAQGAFFLRMVVQWLASEREHRSVVPKAFWYLSFAGGAALFVYAVHRREPVFALGQAVGLFIYARNLMLIHGGRRGAAAAAAAVVIPALGAGAYAVGGAPTAGESHALGSAAWLAVGLAAQSFFFLRFLVQWLTSERRRRSVVPPSFWYLSLAGGLMLSAYAVRRAEPVFLAGQLAGVFIYLRNIMLVRGERGVRVAAAALHGAPESLDSAEAPTSPPLEASRRPGARR
jgi:lipid-A-disaccharide synthase-like uncharacterized protein